jgi:Nuclease-related domain
VPYQSIKDRKMSMTSDYFENLAQGQLAAAFQKSFDDVRVFNNIVIPLPEGRNVNTAEIDALVVCNAGVFIFEVKSWRDAQVFRIAAPGSEKKQWVLGRRNGQQTLVNDPVAQGAEKTIALRAALDERILTQYFVLLPGAGLDLEGTLPASVLLSSDLGLATRTIRTNQRRSNKRFHTLDSEAVGLVCSMIENLTTGLHVEDHVAAVIASKAAAAQRKESLAAQ